MLSDDAGLYKRIADLEAELKLVKKRLASSEDLRTGLVDALRTSRENEEHWRNLYGKQR